MYFPQYQIKSNNEQHHSISPSWLVLFVRFAEPNTFSVKNVDNLLATRPLSQSIVENDCVYVSIDNSKNNVLKTCHLTLKNSDTMWFRVVTPGDWVVVWIHEDERTIKNHSKLLAFGDPTQFKNQLCNWNSGLKFLGRVNNISFRDSVSADGLRATLTNITCISFMEFNTSAYYLYGHLTTPQYDQSKDSIKFGEQIKSPNNSFLEFSWTQEYTKSKIAALRENWAQEYYNLFLRPNKNKKIFSVSPDSLFKFFFFTALSVTSDFGENNAKGLGVRAVHDAIRIPKIIGAILNKPNATFLIEIFNCYIGVQDYVHPTVSAPWRAFVPNFTKNPNAPFFYEPKDERRRLKGESVFTPPRWNNQSIWSILTQFSNNLLNELYSSLRISPDNTITPSIILREKPFTTGLLFATQKLFTSLHPTATTQSVVQNSLNSKTRNTVRSLISKNKFSFFQNLPRWVIHPSRVSNFEMHFSNNRVNLCQVWGLSSAALLNTVNINADSIMAAQAVSGNAVYNLMDIRRHGLYADINESSWDLGASGGEHSVSNAPLWAAMRAGWLMNSALLATGSITMSGVSEPIAEGDNLQYQDYLFHVESVAHRAGITSSGKKFFYTTVLLSNGVLASSLSNATSMPKYICASPVERENIDMPGMTLLQSIEHRPDKSEG